MTRVIDTYELSPMQAGMLFHCELEPESAVYVNVNSLHLRAPFDERALRQTIDRLVARHAVLPTSFHVAEFSELGYAPANYGAGGYGPGGYGAPDYGAGGYGPGGYGAAGGQPMAPV